MFSEVRNHYLPERGMAELVVHKDIDGMFRWQVILPERDGKTGLHVKIEGRYPELDPAVAFRLAASAAAKSLIKAANINGTFQFKKV